MGSRSAKLGVGVETILNTALSLSLPLSLFFPPSFVAAPGLQWGVAAKRPEGSE